VSLKVGLIYFCLFLSGLSARSQTLKLQSELGDETESESVRSVKPVSKRSASGDTKKLKGSSLKLVVDPSLIPTEGSQSNTEAGLNLPGFGENQYPNQNPAPQGTYRPSSSFGVTTVNKGFTSVAGILNAFGLAQRVSQTVAPAAGNEPMFIGECALCKRPEVGGSTVVAPGAPVASMDLEAHNPNMIKDIVSGETLYPFENLNANDRQRFIEALILPMNDFGGFIYFNTQEYTSMCPNFENLNPNQRKAFMVFLYSEIFKSTSNYSLTSKEGGTGVATKYGACQLSHSELSSLYQSYGMEFKPSPQKFVEDFVSDPYKHFTACVAKTYKFTENKTGTANLSSLFPDVNFTEIGQSLKQLNICRGI
jgi:hypothetical protein